MYEVRSEVELVDPAPEDGVWFTFSLTSSPVYDQPTLISAFPSPEISSSILHSLYNTTLDHHSQLNNRFRDECQFMTSGAALPKESTKALMARCSQA